MRANLLRPRDALWYGLTGDPFSGIVAAQIGFVNKAVRLSQLNDTARELAAKLAQKDLWALKATKDGYRHSLDMSWDAAMDYSSAKEMELMLPAFRKQGIGDFLKGQYRPGLESHGGIVALTATWKQWCSSIGSAPAENSQTPAIRGLVPISRLRVRCER